MILAPFTATTSDSFNANVCMAAWPPASTSVTTNCDGLKTNSEREVGLKNDKKAHNAGSALFRAGKSHNLQGQIWTAPSKVRQYHLLFLPPFQLPTQSVTSWWKWSLSTLVCWWTLILRVLNCKTRSTLRPLWRAHPPPLQLTWVKQWKWQLSMTSKDIIWSYYGIVWS